ncbi:MAG: hypothetical protein P8X85_25115 [Desulfobacterales bacterium]
MDIACSSYLWETSEKYDIILTGEVLNFFPILSPQVQAGEGHGTNDYFIEPLTPHLGTAKIAVNCNDLYRQNKIYSKFFDAELWDKKALIEI